MAGFSGGAQQSEVNQGNQGLGNKRPDSGLLLESLIVLAHVTNHIPYITFTILISVAVLLYPKQ